MFLYVCITYITLKEFNQNINNDYRILSNKKSRASIFLSHKGICLFVIEFDYLELESSSKIPNWLFSVS